MKKKVLAAFIAAVSCVGTFPVSSIPLTSIAEKATVEQSVETESPLKDYADTINEYLRSNSVSGYAYIQDFDATEKLLITYVSDLEKIKAYITDLGIDENIVLYSQSHDDYSVSKLSGKIVSLPDKLEYKIGEQIDLTGIRIEAAKGNEKAVVYTYPDVAFDYQSNIPKPATLLLSTDFRSDKTGTYTVKAIDMDNVSFDVNVVDDSILPDATVTIPRTMAPETETAVDSSASDAKFDEDEFFVVVGTYKGSTQLRSLKRRSDGSYAAEKIVWEAAPQGLSYGDVLTAEGKVIMEQVRPASDPVYAMAYYYKLDDSAKLTKVGSCAQLMEKKDLTVERVTYDGSAHWSIDYTDENGEKYYYGLSTYGSSLGVNPTGGKEGDIYTFAAIDGNIVVPLAKKDVESDINKEPEYKIVKLPDKVEYKLGETIDLTGLEIEVTKANEEPVVYTYPDIAFAHDSTTPKPATVLLFSDDFRSDKAGTYKVEVVGADDVSFDVKVVDDSSIKDLEEGKTMTLDDVIELSKKGDDLTWSDFEPYKALDASTCIRNWQYELGNGYILDVGGQPDEKPDFILLGYYSFQNCDVRKENVPGFIDYITETYIFVKGDANFDRHVDMSDAVLVMQALANPNKYGLNGTDEKHLIEQGLANADIDGNGLTVADALAIQRKLLHLSGIDEYPIGGKTFVYEKEGFGSDFIINFYAGGAYEYYEGVLSSYIGAGRWEIEDDTVVMTENISKKVNHLKINGNDLVYIADGSDNFYYLKVNDGEKFSVQPSLTQIEKIKQ